MARHAEISRTEKPWFGHACMKKPQRNERGSYQFLFNVLVNASV